MPAIDIRESKLRVLYIYGFEKVMEGRNEAWHKYGIREGRNVWAKCLFIKTNDERQEMILTKDVMFFYSENGLVWKAHQAESYMQIEWNGLKANVIEKVN